YPTATAIDLSDYRETVTGTNDITVTDDGNGNYTVDYADGDKSDTNEIQNASQVDIADGANNFTSTDVEGALAELAANSTDNQDLSLTGDNLTLTNDPTATAIDLSDYRETVTGTNDITVTDDGNGNYTVDYADGDKSDTNEIQNASQVDIADGANNFTSTDVEGALAELAANSTDNQDLSLTGDNLTLTNDPTATAIDLSDYRETVTGTNDITVTDDGNGNYTVDY
ncbi:hypothetical protein MAR621_04153, partial [Maribacter dokdonensis]|uniref:hypothetical protein n=1 Tax=Maribacter dokdonensis TaxID=320912 RepID=UPI001B12759F